MKLSTVFGASFGKNSITIFPNFVSITATLESAKLIGITLNKSRTISIVENILKCNIWVNLTPFIKANCQILVFNKQILSSFVDSDEHIQAHVLSVWREEKKFFKHGAEGMLFLTDKHVMFVTKTVAKPRWWAAAVERQIRTLLKSDNIMLHHDGYGDEDLRLDLQNEKNVEIPFSQILNVSYEEKSWGGVLNLEINIGDKTKKYQHSIVSGWVKYPAKDPIKYMKANWAPFVDYIKSKQKVME